MVRVFLLTENRLLREALSRILSKKADVRVVGADALCDEALESISKLKPDVLLSDPAVNSLPFGAVAHLRSEAPQLRVVVFGLEENPAVLLRLIRLGVAGYVLKDASATDLCAAVYAVMNQELVCPGRLVLMLFEVIAYSRPDAEPLPMTGDRRLTRRQRQLVPLINEGLTNKEIASQLHLSEQTVKNHVHRILRKTGADDRLKIIEHLFHVRDESRTVDRAERQS